ncbi:MAG TPA: hypothetical protein VGY58_10400 [Gemmataceae bacterium]|nr:hypothetical protein [Gemmataceae bacterium]
MRQRRKGLEVSTFPFLAVLLCTMGSLILLLLVMDRRARAVAEARARKTLEESTLEDAKLVEARRLEWEHRRQMLHAQLASANEDLLKQLTAARGEEGRLSAASSAERSDMQTLKPQLDMQRQQLARWQEELSARRTDIVRASKEAEASQTELAKLAAELRRMEQTLADLKLLRQRQQQTYSLVPYRGRGSDNRKPVYVECTAFSLVFHPDGRTLTTGPGLAGRLKDEIERRLPGQDAPALVGGQKPDAPGYVLLLVRPDGITNYYRLATVLQGLQVDFGYEFIDSDWLLDFSEDETHPHKQPWILADLSDASLSGRGPTRKVTGVQPSKGGDLPLPDRAVDNGSAFLRGRGAALGAGSSTGSPGAGASIGRAGSSTDRTTARGGVQSPSGLGGPSDGSPDGLLGIRLGGVGRGSPFGTAPNALAGGGIGRIGNPSYSGGTAGHSSYSVGQSGNGSPYASTGESPYAAGSAPAAASVGLGPPRVLNGPDTVASPPGSGGGSQQMAAANAGTSDVSVGGEAGQGQGNSPGNLGPSGAPQSSSNGMQTRAQYSGGPGAAADGAPYRASGAGLHDVQSSQGMPFANGGQPNALPSTGYSEGAASPNAGGQNTGSPSTGGEPQSGPGGMLASPVPGPRGGGSGSASPQDATATGNASPAGAGQQQGATAAGTESGPPLPPDPLAGFGRDSQKRSARSSGIRPTLLNGNRDWIIAVDCRADGVTLVPTQQHIAIADLAPAASSNPLAAAVQRIIARRQASVRPGEPPYRPIIHLRVHASGLRAYYLAYPALDPLGVQMFREDSEPDEDSRKNISR